MQVKVENNIKEATTWLTRNRKDMPKITRKALNDTAFLINKVEKVQITKYLSNPTPFTTKAFRLSKATDKKLEVYMFIAPIQANYLWYQIEGGVQPNTVVPVMTNAKAAGRLNKFGNIVGKKGGLIKSKGDFFGKGSGGRTNVYRTKGRVGHTTTKTLFTIKDQSYSAKFPYYRIGEGVAEKNFDNFFNKQLVKAIRGNTRRSA